MSSLVGTVGLQTLNSWAPGHLCMYGHPLYMGCGEAALWLHRLMVLPWPQYPQTGVQSVLDEPAADVLFPSAAPARGRKLCSYVSRKTTSAGSVLELSSLQLALKGHCIQIVHALLITPEC